MNFLGIDPGIHHIGFALVDDRLRIVRVGCLNVEHQTDTDAIIAMLQRLCGWMALASPLDNLMHPYYELKAVALEGQENYIIAEASPRDIRKLSMLAGGVLMALLERELKVYVPKPAEWKGQLDKLESQRLIVSRAGMDPDKYFYVRGGTKPYLSAKPEAGILGYDKVPASSWEHVLDAVGLGQFAAKKWLYEKQKQELLKKGNP